MASRPTLTRKTALLVGTTLVLGFTLTGITAWFQTRAEEAETASRFNGLAERLGSEVRRRFQQPLFGLAGARGVYAASKSVERLEFRAYVSSRDLAREFPGVRGFGYIHRVLRSDLDRFLAAQQADDAPDFQIKSASRADDLFIITFIEPLDTNRSAWGFDIGQEVYRREAATRAARTGTPALTKTIVLVQDGKRGPGFLLLMPIYRNGQPITTEAERWAAHTGWVYAPLVVDELMAGATDSTEHLVDGQLFDEPDLAWKSCLFSTESPIAQVQARPGVATSQDKTYVQRIPIDIGGRTLTLMVSETPAFLAHRDRTGAWMVAVGGSLLTAMTALLIFQLLRANTRAMALATAMTKDLAAAKGRAEDSLRESQTLHWAIQLHAIVSVTDPTGRIISVNPAFCRSSGYALEELIGQDHRIINSGHHSKEFWASVWQTILRGEAWRGEVCNRAKDGSIFWADSIIAPFIGPDGRIEKFITIRTLITDRKLAQAEMAQLNIHLEHQTALANAMAAQAEMASMAKSSFLANMSHEIRTPMNGVLGMTELLLEMGLTPEQEDAARTVYRSAESLLTILNDILDFSKIEAGRLELERISFALDQVLFDVTELFRGRLAGSDVELLVRIAPGTPDRLLGDPARLRQILTNLVGNAVKFTKAGHILLEGEGSAEGLTLRVRDTGIGIPEDRQQALFEPFTQADVSTSRKYGGTGLGLAICRRLVEAMGGGISFTSTFGQGTTFHLQLPLPVDPSPVPRQVAPSLLVGRRILAVDDNPIHRRILDEQLAALGCHGVVVDSAEAVLEKLDQQEPFSAVIIDRLMPGLDGDGLAALIKSRPRHARIPLVLLTATTLTGDTHQLAQLGFTGHLVKPTPTGALGAVLVAVLSAGHDRQTDPPTGLITRHNLAGNAIPTPASAAPTPKELRVLVAEDNPVNQLVIRSMLERLGCRVTVTPDGRAAVTAWRQAPFDLVFMDCQMPEMDGFEATEAIRAGEVGSLRRIPIIALTANAAEEDRERCLAAGMDAHLAKPINLASLSEALARWTVDRSNGAG